MHSLSILAIIGLLGLHATRIAAEAESWIEMNIWQAPMNSLYRTCSAKIHNVEGCTSWTDSFCKTSWGGDFSCNSCKESKEATANECPGIRLELDFESTTPRVYLTDDNDDNVKLSCTLKLDGEKSHEALAWCNPYEPEEPEECEDPSAPSTWHYAVQGGTCVAPET